MCVFDVQATEVRGVITKHSPLSSRGPNELFLVRAPGEAMLSTGADVASSLTQTVEQGMSIRVLIEVELGDAQSRNGRWMTNSVADGALFFEVCLDFVAMQMVIGQRGMNLCRAQGR